MARLVSVGNRLELDLEPLLMTSKGGGGGGGGNWYALCCPFRGHAQGSSLLLGGDALGSDSLQAGIHILVYLTAALSPGHKGAKPSGAEDLPCGLKWVCRLLPQPC